MNNRLPAILLSSFVLTVIVLAQIGKITPNQLNNNRPCVLA
jgi:hypothetical protein